MTRPKLILSPASPYARKVHITALENGLDPEIIHDVPWNEDSNVPRHNPLGKVPVWITGDGRALFDSRVIIEYMEIEGGHRFSSPDPKAYLSIKGEEALIEGVMDASVALMIERTKRPKDLQSDWWIERQFAVIHRGLETLSKRLGKKAYLLDGRLTVADFALISLLGYLNFRFQKDLDLKALYPDLNDYVSRHLTRESVLRSDPSRS